MRKILPFAAVSALFLCGAPAFALESSLTMSSTLSPDALWKKIGDFCGIADLASGHRQLQADR